MSSITFEAIEVESNESINQSYNDPIEHLKESSDTAATITEIAIHPWFMDEDGELFPQCESEDGMEDGGWNVSSYGIFADGRFDIVDDDDFPDFDSAMLHAEALSDKHDIVIDHQYETGFFFS